MARSFRAVALAFWVARRCPADTKHTLHFDSMDLSNSNHCTGTTTPSDCPYNFYRTSGDIYHTWQAMLANLGSTVPFSLGSTPLSRPGAWSYVPRFGSISFSLGRGFASTCPFPSRSHRDVLYHVFWGMTIITSC